MEENTEPCTCGQVHMEYYPDENQHEPACWECYMNSRHDSRDDTKEDFPC